jgi:hypothetical protein
LKSLVLEKFNTSGSFPLCNRYPPEFSMLASYWDPLRAIAKGILSFC